MNKSIVIFVVFLLVSCRSTKDVVFEAPIEYEFELLDTLTVTAEAVESEAKETFTLPAYNPEATRSYDIIHTKLDLSFDWEKQHVLGKASVEISPLFYPINQVILDAKQFIIHEVKLIDKNQTLNYTYDNHQLKINLDRLYTRKEKLTLFIDYTARPNEGPIGGSQAITSDKGLFFINPTGKIKGKPRQIWTQGETENNSKWFPTFDKPNERCTQEIFLTVEEDLETLSNGLLISSKDNGNGTKTDYWKMEKPHAPYLFMLMIGDFARVEDSWNGKLLEYMVDPPYRDAAKEIFNHTPEMLTFFSDLLDYPYPWDKYSQVIAEDYVSGAMENTTAVIFGDFTQKTKRELIDNGNDKIVAHEMFHHWFGDLVTCESWANLTLNEGFANYSEYLWYEHKYGKDAADAHRISEMEGYFGSYDRHPLIHYGYGNKEEMFDVHSYNKGGLVLHMLRTIVGDEAFFASLSKYLKDNAYTSVETAELRMAFEETTGQDMNWFFDQWYLDSGHPEINVSYDYKDNTVYIYTEQTQSPDKNRPIFILPLDAAIYAQDGSVSYRSIIIDSRKDTITIPNIVEKPLATVMDGKSVLLAQLNEDRTIEEYGAILQHSQNHFDKRMALQQLMRNDKIWDYSSLLMQDNHFILRSAGLEYAQIDQKELVKKMSTEDPHSAVRMKALQKYYDLVQEKALPVAQQILKTEQAYRPIFSAIDIINNIDSTKGRQIAESMMNDKSNNMVGYLSTFFANTGNPKYLQYIENNLPNISDEFVFSVYGSYKGLLLDQDLTTIEKRIPTLQHTALNSSSVYKRFLSMTILQGIKNKLQDTIILGGTDPAKIEGSLNGLNIIIKNIISQETDEFLLQRYRTF